MRQILKIYRKKILLGVKKQKAFVKKSLILGSSNIEIYNNPENFPETFMIGTTAYRRLEITSVSSDSLKLALCDRHIIEKLIMLLKLT